MRRFASRVSSLSRLTAQLYGLPLLQREACTTHLIAAVDGGFILGCHADSGAWLYAFHTASTKPVEKGQPYPVLVVDFSGSMHSYDFGRFADEAVIAYVNQFVRASRSAGEEETAASASSEDQAAFKKVPAARLLAFSQRCVDHVLSKATVRDALSDCVQKLRQSTCPELAMQRLVDVVSELPAGSHIATIFLTDGEFNGRDNYKATWRDLASRVKEICAQRGSTMQLCIVGLKDDSLQNVRDMCDAFRFANPEYVTITTKSEIVPAFVRSARVALGSHASGKPSLALPTPTGASRVHVFADIPHVSNRQVHDGPVVDIPLATAFTPMATAVAAGIDAVKYAQWAPRVVDEIIAVEATTEEVKALTSRHSSLEATLETTRTTLEARRAELATLKVQYRELFPPQTGVISDDVWVAVLENCLAGLQQCVADAEAMSKAKSDKERLMWRERVHSGVNTRSARRALSSRVVTESAMEKISRIDLGKGQAKTLEDGTSTVVEHRTWGRFTVKAELADLNKTYACALTKRTWSTITEGCDALCLPITISETRPVDAYWEPSRLPVKSVGALCDAISAEEHNRIEGLFGKHWASSSGIASATHALPIRTDPFFEQKLDLFVAKLGHICKNESDVESGFCSAHVHAYVAALRCVFANFGSAGSPDAREVEKAMLLLFTYRGLFERIPLALSGTGVPRLLHDIYFNRVPRSRFRSGWEAIALALAASPAEYTEAAGLASKPLQEFRHQVMKNACHAAYLTETVQGRSKADNATDTPSAPPNTAAFSELFSDGLWSQWTGAPLLPKNFPLESSLPRDKRPWTLDVGQEAPTADTTPVRFVERCTSTVLGTPSCVTSLADAFIKSGFGNAISGALSMHQLLQSFDGNPWAEMGDTMKVPARLCSGSGAATTIAVPTPPVTVALLSSKLMRKVNELYTPEVLRKKLTSHIDRASGQLNAGMWSRQRSWECRYLPTVFTASQIACINELFSKTMTSEVQHQDDFEAKLRDILRKYSCLGLDANNDDALRDGTPRSVELLFRAAKQRPCHLKLKPTGLPDQAIAFSSSPLFLLPLSHTDFLRYLKPLKFNRIPERPVTWKTDLHCSLRVEAHRCTTLAAFHDAMIPHVKSLEVPLRHADEFLEDAWLAWRESAIPSSS